MLTEYKTMHYNFVPGCQQILPGRQSKLWSLMNYTLRYPHPYEVPFHTDSSGVAMQLTLVSEILASLKCTEV